jgi:predicted small secreted protein
MMTKRYFPLALIALLSTTLASCEAIQGIFKAGMVTGIVVVGLVIALIIWLVSKVF